ncbi:MAG: FAD-dependent oxidoreductase, partial [Candidatus Omnitrophica bacterium]|nr:FAD-dependent oxidoreductase [Candidatus Omnitrophota bacterium]
MKHIVIIGNSAAGINAAKAIRSQDEKVSLTIISDEKYFGYCRCLISYMLAGALKEENLIIQPEQFYKDLNINLIRGKKAEKINPKKNCVLLEDKTKIDYDALIVATGASPKIPEDLKGAGKHGVFGFRTINDVKDIMELVPISRTACVLGGGLIGLKAAYGLNKRGLEIKVVVRSNRVLSQMLDEGGAALFLARFAERGIEVLTESDVVEVVGNGDVKAVKLNTGKVVGCGIVVVGKGVSPNVKLVKDTEIKVDKGIVTDDFMCTSINNIFAAGDVAQTLDIIWQAPELNALWPVAVEQGKIAGSNALKRIGGKEDKMIKYAGSLSMNAIEFFDLPVISMGMVKVPKDKAQSYEEIIAADRAKGIYRKVMLKDNCVVGFIGVGQINNSGVFLKLIKEKTD